MTDSTPSRRVLLIVGGGVAAYKALELTRLLRKAGVGVRPILTKAGAEFVTALSLSALAEDKVYSDLFSLTDEAEMGHIELSRSADLVVVAPATADLIAKAAHGLAGDLASTALLATDKPVLMAPAMNVRMWLHPATQRNIEILKTDGALFVGPDEGAMACGEFGPGRLAEPPAIFEAIMAALEGPAAKPLAGKHALVTAGPTFEPIDPVRGITNRSRAARATPSPAPWPGWAPGSPWSAAPSPWPRPQASTASMSRPPATCWPPARPPCPPTSGCSWPPSPTGASTRCSGPS